VRSAAYPVAGKKSVIQQTKNEPVVGRNIFQRA